MKIHITTSVSSQISLTMIAEGVGFLSALAFSVIVTRELQPIGKGVFSAAISAVAIALSISGFGISKSLVFFLNRKEYDPGRILGATLLLIPAMSLASVALLLVLLSGQQTNTATVIGIGVMVCLIQQYTSIVESILRASRRIHSLNLASAIQSIGQIALLCVAVKITRMTPAIVLTTVMIAWTLRLLFLSHALANTISYRPILSCLGPSMKAMIGFGFAYYIQSMLWSLHCKMDIILLQWMSSSADTGIYTTGANLAQMLWRFPTAVTFVTIPYMAQMGKARDGVEFTSKTIRISLVILSIVALLMGLFAQPLVLLLYGESFLPATKPLRILLPGAVASALYLFVAANLVARGELTPLIAIGAITTGLNVVLNLFLIPALSGVGSAIASTLTYSGSFLLIVIFFVRKGGVQFKDMLTPRLNDFRDILVSWRR